MTLGPGGVSDVGLTQVNLRAPPPLGTPFDMVVHVNSPTEIEVTVGDDGPYPFRLPLDLPAVGYAGVYAKYGRVVVENAIVEIVP